MVNRDLLRKQKSTMKTKNNFDTQRHHPAKQVLRQKTKCSSRNRLKRLSSRWDQQKNSSHSGTLLHRPLTRSLSEMIHRENKAKPFKTNSRTENEMFIQKSINPIEIKVRPAKKKRHIAAPIASSSLTFRNDPPQKQTKIAVKKHFVQHPTINQLKCESKLLSFEMKMGRTHSLVT